MKFNLYAKALLMGGAIAMVACTNDEPNMGNGDNTTNNSGDRAYLNVTIKSADKMSKAITTPGYEDGTKDEQKVRTVDFFFFDDKGASMDLSAYLVDANASDEDIALGEPGNKAPNVEKVFANNLLVLDKLTDNKYPTYMITVLNAHDFECGTNLTNTLEKLANWESASKDSKGYFVMSTSSYSYSGTDTDKRHDDAFYHATKLNIGDFYLTPGDAKNPGNSVEVYVERLAAKVQLSMKSDFKADNVTYEGETFDIYELEQTVSGGDNTGNQDLNTKLYLRVLGWNLNTTAKQSYMSKNIDITKWNANKYLAWTWNVPGDFRSYWATSTVYGATAANIDSYVDYVTSDNLKYAVAAPGAKAEDIKVAYCNENTNNPANFVSKTEKGEVITYQVDSRIATNVVLKTQIVDKTGKPIDMIQANGILFKEDSYMKYIINRAFVGGTNALNIYKLVTSTTEGDLENGEEQVITTSYQQIGTEYFDVQRPEGATRVGAVEVIVKADATFTGDFYYFDSKAEGTAEDPTYKKYNEGENLKLADAIETAKKAIAEAQESAEATIYDNGYNVYYIPVEHLGAEEKLSLLNEAEGYYGVVRNHWYKLAISKFSKVGHGIWDPDNGEFTETLKPNKPEDPLYYLGAEINILSWKVVQQDVEL